MIVCWLLLVGCGLLVVVCWLWFVGCCPLFDVRCLFVDGGWLFVVRCLKFVACLCFLFCVTCLLFVCCLFSVFVFVVCSLLRVVCH